MGINNNNLTIQDIKSFLTKTASDFLEVNDIEIAINQE